MPGLVGAIDGRRETPPGAGAPGVTSTVHRFFDFFGLHTFLACRTCPVSVTLEGFSPRGREGALNCIFILSSGRPLAVSDALSFHRKSNQRGGRCVDRPSHVSKGKRRGLEYMHSGIASAREKTAPLLSRVLLPWLAWSVRLTKR